MGTNVSKQSIESLTSVVNKSLMKITTEIKNSNTTNQSSYQPMFIDLGKVRGCVNITATQRAEISANVLLENSSEIANKMTTELMNSIQKELTNTLKQTNEDLNLGQTNIGVLETNSKSYIENYLEHDITTGITNAIKTNQRGGQSMTFYARDIECADGGSLVFNQDMVMKTVSKNISTNIVNNTIKAAVTNDIKEKIKQEVVQLNKGIDIFAIFTVIIIVICVVLGGFAYLRTGGISKALSKNIDKMNPDDLGALGALGGPGVPGVPGVASFYGGDRRSRIKSKNSLLKMKLIATAAVCIGLFYEGYYKPEKEKIKDKYAEILK